MILANFYFTGRRPKSSATFVESSHAVEPGSAFNSQFTHQEWGSMKTTLRNLWNDDQGQDIAEYAVMLAVILVLVVGTIRLVGSNSNNVFSNVASSIQ